MSNHESNLRPDEAQRRRDAGRRRDPLREEVPDEEVRRATREEATPEPGMEDPRRETNTPLTDPLERRII